MPSGDPRRRAPHAHGTVVDELRVDGIRVREVRHAPGHALPAHAHDTTNLCVLLEGGAAERCGIDIHVSAPLTLVARSAGALHENQYHARGARWLVADLDPADRRVRAAMAGSIWRSTPRTLAAALVAAFRARGSERPRLVQVAVGEALDSMQRRRPRTLAWLDAARAILVERLTDPPTIDALAREVGVHPIHLAQTFRAHAGTTPGGFVRAHRVFRAMELVGAGVSLAAAAHAAGFADQSHMTRAVHADRGAPPGALRLLSSAP